uniref:Uncharacterized protein n=1 Tax=Talaromyces marneffei PM1 TaxID=1077442 RepID=A0A093Y844_TALMA
MDDHLTAYGTSPSRNCNVLATVNGGQCHPPNHAVRRAYPITPELAATPPGRAYALTTPQNQNVRQSPEFAVRNGWNQETLLRRLQPGSQLDDTPSPLTTRS